MLLKSEGSHREALEDRLLRLQPVFAISRTGKPVITHTRLQGSVQAGTRTAALAGVNVRPRADSAFAYTSFWGDTTPVDSAAIEFVVRDGRVVRVDAEPAGVAIPENGAVIAVKGTVRARFATVAAGDSMTWTAGFAGLDHPLELVGGYPMLLVDGAPVHHQEAGLRPPFSDRRHPRAAIGIDRAGRIHVLAVDGRQPGYSEGMTLEEFSAFLLAHGITDALNFDGGGSTTLVVRGRIVNRPSDSSGERAVANALLILDRSQASSCARSR
jgi:exopolysaccharide biosynthesis protein